MTERVCTYCGGSGKIHAATYNGSIGRKIECPECAGTGKIKEIVTNGDRIRQMNNEELARFFGDHCLLNDDGGFSAENEWFNWLDQEAKDEQ